MTEPGSDDAPVAAGDVSTFVEDLRIDLRRKVDEAPLKMIALAVGAGYLLGGGLFTGLTVRTVGLGLRIGVRLAAIPLIREELVRIVDSFHTQRVSERSSAQH